MSATTAIVTGGAAGIGAAIAARLAADGNAIAVADIDLAAAEQRTAALRDQGHTAQAFHVDVSDERSVDLLVQTVLAWRDTIDVLVNNAGITGPHGSLATYDVATIRRIIDIDLIGTMLCTRATVAHMVARGVAASSTSRRSRARTATRPSPRTRPPRPG